MAEHTVPRQIWATVDEDGATALTVGPRNEQTKIQVDAGGGRRAVIYLSDGDVDALAEHLMHRHDRRAALDRHIQGLRTLGIRYGSTPHLRAAIEHLVDDLRGHQVQACSGTGEAPGECPGCGGPLPCDCLSGAPFEARTPVPATGGRVA